MRQMPTKAQATLNPNDYTSSMKGGPGFQKKQFVEMNQHIFHHNAVLPTAGVQESSNTRNVAPHSFKDPYANIPIKPNQMSIESANQLQK